MKMLPTMFYNLYTCDDDDSCFYDESHKMKPAYLDGAIEMTKNELSELTGLMTFLLGEWRYDTIEDVMAMRTLIGKHYDKVHPSCHGMFDRTWNLLRRLTNMYFLSM